MSLRIYASSVVCRRLDPTQESHWVANRTTSAAASTTTALTSKPTSRRDGTGAPAPARSGTGAGAAEPAPASGAGCCSATISSRKPDLAHLADGTNSRTNQCLVADAQH